MPAMAAVETACALAGGVLPVQGRGRVKAGLYVLLWAAVGVYAVYARAYRSGQWTLYE